MGKEDIEGEWLSVVRVGGKIHGGAFSEIYFQKGSYIERGEHFNLSGVKVLEWKALISAYDGRQLRYSYFATRYINNLRVDGNCEYNFHTLWAPKNRLLPVFLRRTRLSEYGGYVANNVATISPGLPEEHGIYGVNGMLVNAFVDLCQVSNFNRTSERGELVQRYIEHQRRRLEI